MGQSLRQRILTQAREVRQYKKMDYKRWAKEKDYGKRWVCTEGIFSAVKRIFVPKLNCQIGLNNGMVIL
jgi:hypothetical protein